MDQEINAFRTVFTNSYPRLLAYARRRASPAVADDVVAETFLVAWRRRSEVMAMNDPLPWLYAVAGNQLRTANRSADRQHRLAARVAAEPTASVIPTEPATPGADEISDPDDNVDRLHEALAGLSFDDQEVLRLVTWEELSHRETAAVLECSVDAVAQRVHRARQRLARALADLRTTGLPSAPPSTTNGGQPSANSRGALT